MSYDSTILLFFVKLYKRRHVEQKKDFDEIKEAAEREKSTGGPSPRQSGEMAYGEIKIKKVLDS